MRYATSPSKCQKGPIKQSILILKTTDSKTERTIVSVHAGTAAAEVQVAGVGDMYRTKRTRPVVGEAICEADLAIAVIAATCNNEL